MRSLLDTVCSIAGKTYGKGGNDDVSIRVITDHVRSATFMICDGVIPSNEGRGYVLRRILRRACRHGKLLGIKRRFLPELSEIVIAQNVGAYPELADKKGYILNVIALEEERFDQTIDQGLGILGGLIEGVVSEGKKVLDGASAFKLYDTYGFPVDLTREIVEEQGLTIDEEGFRALMEEQRCRARAARGNVSGWSDTSRSALESLDKTEFVGYTADAAEAKVVAIVSDGELVDAISEGEFSLVFDRTPFYGEGGGQVGDTGVIEGAGAKLAVLDTQKTDGVYIHIVKLEEGEVKVGDVLTLTVDAQRRDAIRRNHTAAHLLQAALRSVLGTHVEQAGSYVDPARVRFDFSHYKAMTPEEIAEVEARVNAHILAAEGCETVETDIETARSMGAMALFGEKYGDTVRVVKAGVSSIELCGGTHVSNTGNIGLFKVLSETSVAAGVRRIEGTTGLGVLTLLAERDHLIREVARELKTQNTHDVAKKAAALQGELKMTRREVESLSSKISDMQMQSLLSSVKDLGRVKLLAAKVEMRPDAARSLCDTVKASSADTVALFAAVSDGKLNFVCAAGADAVKAGAHAGKIVGEISAICGGKGGGRPDSAMSGGKDLSKIAEALAHAEEMLKNL